MGRVRRFGRGVTGGGARALIHVHTRVMPVYTGIMIIPVCPSHVFLRPRHLVVRNAFSRNGFVFDRNFFEILKIFRSQTPEDLVLEWFRRRNGPGGRTKVGIHRCEVQYQACLRSRQRFLGVWSVQNGAWLRDLGVRSVLGSPQCGLSARFCSGGFVFDRNFSQRKTPRGVCFRIEFRETPA